MLERWSHGPVSIELSPFALELEKPRLNSVKSRKCERYL
jgi:hypothetical protein